MRCSPLLGWADLQLMAMSCLKLRGQVPANLATQYDETMRNIANWMVAKQDNTGSLEGNPIATTIVVQVSSLR